MTDGPVVVTPSLLRDWPLPDVTEAASKNDRGAVAALGGAHHTPGALLLAGLAALRAGAGKLTMGTVGVTAAALAVTVPEAGVTALPATGGGLGADAVDGARGLIDGADAVVLGPGMAGVEEARAFVGGLLPAMRDTTLVLDAMGLTCGALDAGAAAALDGRVVVTPNTTEAGMLLGDDVDDPLEAARRLAGDLGVVVALHSWVVAPDGRAWCDGSGHSGLGTSGSGDVLAGVIAGLAARGATPEQAAVWGVHLHAEAGERLAARIGRVGFLARELLDEIPQVLGQLAR